VAILFFATAAATVDASTLRIIATKHVAGAPAVVAAAGIAKPVGSLLEYTVYGRPAQTATMNWSVACATIVNGFAETSRHGAFAARVNGARSWRLPITVANPTDCFVDVSVEIAQGYVGLVIWTR
jgi:hypothetical protein